MPERPRVEPEIIPPDGPSPGPAGWGHHIGRAKVSTFAGETHRLYVGRLGPFGLALLMLIIGIVVAAILLAAVGAILLWIPVIALILAVGAISRLLRR